MSLKLYCLTESDSLISHESPSEKFTLAEYLQQPHEAIGQQPPHSMPQTVKFNVGGKLFETAQSLVDQHEGTMLARLVSETWNDDPSKPVFIDRNGDIFSHVLDYLRYGSITLPAMIPKDMFLRDLDFYGIIPDQGTVKTYSEGWANEVVRREERIKNIDAEKKALSWRTVLISWLDFMPTII